MCSEMCPCREPNSIAKQSWDVSEMTQDEYEFYGRDILNEPLVWVSDPTQKYAFSNFYDCLITSPEVASEALGGPENVNPSFVAGKELFTKEKPQ